jgi:hypothetical protein
MKTSEYAFPSRKRWDPGTDGFDLENEGMTLTQYAAIHLKVPCSGDPELDKMIRESRRLDFAGQVLGGLLASEVPEVNEYSPEGSARAAFEFTDALLAEWEKAGEEAK